MSETFSCYTPETVAFLAELSLHNSRDWFKANQDRYESLVREPTRALVRAMSPRLAKISRHLVADDRKVGGSMMRPQRDTRFSPDKTPYKTNVGVQFRHEAGKDVHAPGLYFHFDPESVFLAAGTWRPDPPTLAAVRRRIVSDARGWKRARDDGRFREAFDLGGESLKRPPRGFDADHPLVEDLKRKDHVAVADLAMDELFAPGLPDRLAERLGAARPYMRFLCRALDVDF